jgi:hypothetical protein
LNFHKLKAWKNTHNDLGHSTLGLFDLLLDFIRETYEPFSDKISSGTSFELGSETSCDAESADVGGSETSPEDSMAPSEMAQYHPQIPDPRPVPILSNKQVKEIENAMADTIRPNIPSSRCTCCQHLNGNPCPSPAVETVRAALRSQAKTFLCDNQFSQEQLWIPQRGLDLPIPKDTDPLNNSQHFTDMTKTVGDTQLDPALVSVRHPDRETVTQLITIEDLKGTIEDREGEMTQTLRLEYKKVDEVSVSLMCFLC